MIFSCACFITASFIPMHFWEVLIKYCACLFLLNHFLVTDFMYLQMYFEYKSFVRYAACKCFLPTCGLSFHFLNSIFEELNLNLGVQFINCFFYELGFWC